MICAYLASHWPQVGPRLVGEPHVIRGDEDNFYLKLVVYKPENFLGKTKRPVPTAEPSSVEERSEGAAGSQPGMRS